MAEGGTIYSDMAAMYVDGRQLQSHLEPFPYEHYWVNHTERWVDEMFRDIHVNGIERSWRSLKQSISHLKRPLTEDLLDSHIAMFILKCNVLDEDIHDVFLVC